ncbi:MAG TPA: YkgJ family cysteine cluster protein, partial [Candidatus Binatia bacterium]
GCGRCCTGTSGYVWVNTGEIRSLASALGLAVDEFGRRYVRSVAGRYALVDRRGGDCIFLDGKSCSVYEHRPAQCRAYPWWPANLRSPASWEKAATLCEGISALAPVVVAELIDDGLRQARGAGLAEGSEDGSDGE